ncbi:hypothetical protein ACLB1Q_34710 [Escherichia coli]
MAGNTLNIPPQRFIVDRMGKLRHLQFMTHV